MNTAFDIVIIGGGVVGLSAAIAMRQRDFSPAWVLPKKSRRCPPVGAPIQGSPGGTDDQEGFPRDWAHF